MKNNNEKYNISYIVHDNLCTACGSCWQICPESCISIIQDDEGFDQPFVDSTKCIKCKKCIKACPLTGDFIENNIPKNCHAVQAEDAFRLDQCASGGVFSVIAENFIDDNSYVCGAVFDYESCGVKHIITNNPNELYKIRGSKYVQSSINNSYANISHLLANGKRVLFGGTPCQVAGLYSFLGGKPRNLFTIDLVCEGVPSHGMFRKYIEEEFGTKKISGISFRDKETNGWHNFYINFKNDDREIVESRLTNPFTSLFLNCVINRKVCYSCPFQKFPRLGDITIGDYWGIEEIDPGMDDDKGTSLVLFNSKKGKLLFKQSKINFKIDKLFAVDTAIKNNHNLIEPSEEHKYRDLAFKLFAKNYSINEINKLVLGNKCDIALLNVWFAKNYGATLTCYGLYKTLIDAGYFPKVINFVPKDWHEKFKDSFSEKFANDHMRLTKQFNSVEKLSELNEDIDIFIAGSDQLWRYEIYKDLGGNIYQLDFTSTYKNRIACSVSFGEEEYCAPEEEEQVFKLLVKDFNSISVRENSGQKILAKMGIQSTVLCDPVFAVTKSDWLNLSEKPKTNKDKYFATYILGGGHEDRPLKWVDNTINNISMQNKINPLKLTFKKNYSVEKWLGALANSEFIVTDSFHAACFSIIFNKPLVFLVNHEKILQRVTSIFKHYDVKPTILHKGDNSLNSSVFIPINNFDNANKKINKDRQIFIDWLINAIERKLAKDDSSNNDVVRKLIYQRNIDREKIKELANENQALRFDLDYYYRKYIDISKSFSWFITKPYRFTSRLTKRLFRFIK